MVYQYVYEHGDERKDHRTESQTEGKILLPGLVAWNTLNTRGSPASRRHTEILNCCNSYPWKLFGNIMNKLNYYS